MDQHEQEPEELEISLGSGEDDEDEAEYKRLYPLRLSFSRLTARDASRYIFGCLNDRTELRKAVKVCKEFAAGETSYHMLTLAGPAGVGKTHLAKAIVLE